jgi:hypothetical protein
VPSHPSESRAAAAVLAALLLLAAPAGAQQPGVDELLRRIEALQRRVDELESRQRATQREVRPPAAAVATAPARPPVNLRAYAEQDRYNDPLDSGLDGLSIRIPNTDTEVRLYGFVKLSAYRDFEGRNSTHAPLPSRIPLTGSGADRQGGEFAATPQFSRFGFDTRSPTAWGTLETRLEGDFAGDAPSAGTLTFRLRQAWAEIGGEQLRVLIGQANSLWNEGLYETIIDATNLNQSFIRQAQLRLSGRLAPGWTGQVSLEAPESDFTSAQGTFAPNVRFEGGASPAFDSWPDLHGRLSWRDGPAEFVVRGFIRDISAKTTGTAAAPPEADRNVVGYGIAAHGRLPLARLSSAFGFDELLGMAFWGEGIGRYFFGNSLGIGAVASLGLPGAVNDFSLDAVESYGFTAGYRRFWTPRLRSNFTYSYARNDFPAFVRDFTPGSNSALILNRELQQAFANLIWSPFATVTDAGMVRNGWLDIGLEYLFTRRDIEGGAAAAQGAGGVGHGIAHRFMGAVVARF